MLTFSEALAEHPELELHGLVVLAGGEPVIEQHWAPYTADDRCLVYSASKTFAASAVAIAIGEGRFGLDDKLVDLLPTPGGTAEPTGEPITVHHVLSMSTGHTEDTLEAITAGPPAEWAARFLAIAPQAPVGSCHVYNNGASFVLGELIRQRTGEDLLDYLRPRLLEPLGIDATWDRDELGRCLGWSGIHVTTRALAAMGELYRCDGVWQGRRLLPEGWVAAAGRCQIPTNESSPDWDFGYGYQVWMGREGYRLDGAYGQFALVLPERDLVVAITSAQSCTQVLLDLVWDVLLPELDSADRRAPVEPAQTEQAIPLPEDSGLGTEWAAAGAVAFDAELLEPGEEPGEPADVADVSVRREGESLRLSLTTEGHRVELTTTPGRWHRQLMRLGETEVPVALAAGVDLSGDLHARLVLTDTPHTLRLRLRTQGSAGQAWKVSPLQGPGLSRMVAR